MCQLPVDFSGLRRVADVDATRVLYQSFAPYVCDCSYCRNFRAQWDDIITDQVRDALQAAGIDPRRPVEVVEYGKGVSGRDYGVEWAFVGLLEMASEKTLGTSNLDRVQVGFGGIPEPTFDQSGRRWSVHVRFDGVPWRLPEPEPE